MAMQEYADQETQSLKAELAEKENLYDDLLTRHNETLRIMSCYVLSDWKLNSELEMKDEVIDELLDFIGKYTHLSNLDNVVKLGNRILKKYKHGIHR
jgi:hypothetical protein